MTQLKTYKDFLERVDELGYMPLSSHPAGLRSLAEETASESWHTDTPETDPWQWKDRAATEKQAAYGCVIYGQKGFISARLYPFFYAFYHPAQTLEERYAAGELKQTTWQAWQVLEKGALLSGELRRALGVGPHSGAGRVDASLQELQREFWVAIAGSRQKLAKNGQPYGWPNSVYDTVQRWAPPAWFDAGGRITRLEARETILATGLAHGPNVTRAGLAQALGLD